MHEGERDSKDLKARTSEVARARHPGVVVTGEIDELSRLLAKLLESPHDRRRLVHEVDALAEQGPRAFLTTRSGIESDQVEICLSGPAQRLLRNLRREFVNDAGPGVSP